MAGLLAAPTNTQASILYGAGNKDITSKQIVDYINTPGMTDAQIQKKAVELGVSADQISTAMAGDKRFSPASISSYLGNQGITPQQQEMPEPEPYKPIQYNPISNVTATQDPTKGTVAGQLETNLDPNSQLMQRAAYMGNVSSNRRGLLNSSIGVSAAMAPMIDAGLQIATPDAASNNQFNLFNTQNQNETNRFNASNTLSSDVANAGNLKDLSINSSNNAVQMAVANLDVNTKLKIANIDAASKDSSLAASLNQSLMQSIVEINKQDKPVAVREAEISQLVNLTTKSIGLLQSFDAAVPSLDFSDISGTSSSAKAEDSTVRSDSPSEKKINSLGYAVEPAILGQVANYEKATGTTVDRSRVAPEALAMDFKIMGSSPLQGVSYTASDGTSRISVPASAYDTKSLMEKYGVKYPGELFDKIFAPVHPPGSMRADNPMFYVYR
jgi:hypothetical protein